MFITFEGVEGSGKSTQIKLLAEAFKKRGQEVVVTREPGGTPIGDQIRKILLDGANTRMVSACEVLLYWAARAQHVAELVRPALTANRLVLCDRYTDSTLAYQGFARGVDFKTLDTLDQVATERLKPDKTFLFDLDVEEGLKRARKRIGLKPDDDKEDRFENEILDFHRKVRDGFLTLAKREPKRFVVLDASASVADLHSQVLAALGGLKS